MALSSVEQAVVSKAQAEAEAVLQKARDEADALFERQSARLREEHERRVETLRQTLETDMERDVGAQQTAGRQKLLETKNAIIEEVFAQALKDLLTLPDGGYVTWLKARVAALPPLEGAVIVGNARDRDELQQAVTAAGRTDLTVADETAAVQGGFLVQGAQFDLDVSVEALMADLREALTEEIATKLFAEGDA